MNEDVIVSALLLACSLAVYAGNTEDLLKEQARIHPESFEANHNLGEYYAHTGDLKEAILWLQRAYELDASRYNNAYDLALALFESKQIADARRVAQQMLARQDASELHNLLGAIEDADGKIVDGVRQFEIAARMDPSEKNIFDLGSDLLNHQGFEQAITIFEYGGGRYPQSAKLRVGLGIAYYSASRWKDAVETLCRAADLDPRDLRVLEFLGKMVDVSPELADEVSKRLARFAELYPDNAAANYYYALSLRDRPVNSNGVADTSEVEIRLKKAITLDPQMADAHYQLGVLYQDGGQADPAIREFETVIKLRPAFRSAHYRLARLYAAQGKKALSSKEFQIVRTLPADAASK